jgi:hypothetical protein
MKNIIAAAVFLLVSLTGFAVEPSYIVINPGTSIKGVVVVGGFCIRTEKLPVAIMIKGKSLDRSLDLDGAMAAGSAFINPETGRIYIEISSIGFISNNGPDEGPYICINGICTSIGKDSASDGIMPAAVTNATRQTEKYYMIDKGTEITLTFTNTVKLRRLTNY